MLPYILGIFIIIYVALIIFMVRSSGKLRSLISDTINTISSSFILVSIFMLIYNEYLKRNEQKNNRVLNDKLLGNIYALFFEHKDKLAHLHNEIFRDSYKKNNDNTNNVGDVTLSYWEYISLQVIFTTFLNIYRQYYITGGEADMITRDLYESLDNIIKRVSSSPKAQMFWNENKEQFRSLGFIEWMSKRYMN